MGPGRGLLRLVPRALRPVRPAARGGEPDSLDAFLALVHPDDRDAVRAAAHDALASGEYLAEFRILRPAATGGEETAWLIGRGRRMPSPAGRVGPILGVNVDITARKEAEERQALLMREVDHRAKNALAVVQAVLRLTRAETMPAFAKAVEGRVSALARAQTLLTESRWTGADFQRCCEANWRRSSGAAAVPRFCSTGRPCCWRR
jgi:hypothetical protein